MYQKIKICDLCGIAFREELATYWNGLCMCPDCFNAMEEDMYECDPDEIDT